MSRIDELIGEACPDGVPHMTLSDPRVATFATGKQLNRATLSASGEYAVYNGGIDPSGRFAEYNTVGPAIIVSQGGASAGYVNFVRENFWAGAHCYVVLPGSGLNQRFLYHALKANQSKIQGSARGAGIPGLSRGALGSMRIPVPPLEVQREIVGVLDKFTQLEAELEAELEARRAQYEHYRRALLNGGGTDRSRMLPLGDVFEMRAGVHVKASEISDRPTEERPYPCYGGNGLRGFVSSHNYDESVIFVGRQGALCGNVHRAQGKIYATEHAVVVTPKAPVDMSWAFHKLAEMNLNQYKTKSAQPGLAVGRIKQIEVEYLPLEDQRRVGATLDKLDALVNDISIGLPAELAARRKQYEYYRDRLLTFKELAA